MASLMTAASYQSSVTGVISFGLGVLPWGKDAEWNPQLLTDTNYQIYLGESAPPFLLAMATELNWPALPIYTYSDVVPLTASETDLNRGIDLICYWQYHFFFFSFPTSKKRGCIEFSKQSNKQKAFSYFFFFPLFFLFFLKTKRGKRGTFSLYSIAFSAFVLRALQSAPELHDARNSILNLIDPTCALDKSIITLPEMLTELAPLLQNPRLFDNTEHFHRLKSLCNKEKKRET